MTLLNPDELSEKELRKIVQSMVDEEHNTGRALVDVQNWLSKDGKENTRLINKFLSNFLQKHGVAIRL